MPQGTPRGNKLVDEYVGGVGGYELRCCGGEHVGAAAESVSEDDDEELAAQGDWSVGRSSQR